MTLFFSKSVRISILILSFFFCQNVFAESGQELLDSLLSTWNSFDSMRASITINGLSGTLSYKRPGNVHLKLADGRVLSGNGRHLWIFSRYIAGKQDLKGMTGGLPSLLSGYENVTASGKTLRLRSDTKYYEEIVVSLTPNNMPRSIRLKPKGRDSFTEITFSGIQTNIGIPASSFNFHPPANAQIVENPLNQRE